MSCKCGVQMSVFSDEAVDGGASNLHVTDCIDSKELNLLSKLIY